MRIACHLAGACQRRHGWPVCRAALGGLTLAMLAGGCALIGSAPHQATAIARHAHRDRLAVRARARAPSPPGSPAPLAIAERTHEYPSPAPPAEHARPHASPQLALLLYATAYINWKAADVAAHLRVLAAASVGQARSAMQLQAAQVAADSQLRAGGIANHGSVEAIAPLYGSNGAGRYVIVTREWTTASSSAAYQGLLPAWHVTIATVRREGQGWVVSGWQPES